jgi:hypothetical protein
LTSKKASFYGRSESIAASEKRLTIKEIKQALSPKYEELFQDPVFESWLLAKENKHKYGLSLSSFSSTMFQSFTTWHILWA